MDQSHSRVVRFGEWLSDSAASPQKPPHPQERPFLETQSSSFGSPFHAIHRGLQKSSQRIQSLRESLNFHSPYTLSANKPDSQNTVLDPQGPFLQRWNNLFLFSCVVAMACDPLFLYIPYVDKDRKCLNWDPRLKTAACVLRTFTDLFYLLHMILQFRTGFVSPDSRILGRGELVKDHAAIARRYIFSFFIIDVLAVLPLPQLAVLYSIPRSRGLLTPKGLLKYVIFIQYLPRLIRIYPIYEEVTRTSGIITQTAWAGAALNLILYMLASHVFGALWYLFAIDKQDNCWRKACQSGCHNLPLFCGNHHVGKYTYNETYCAVVDPDKIGSTGVFNYGMYYDAVDSEMVQSRQIFKKLIYCFWWGLRNLSSLGQNLKTNTSISENAFAIFICVAGLFLFALLIGNMQEYLQSTSVREEEMRVRRQDAEQWMSHRMLPDDLRKRIRRYEQYKWQETRGVDEQNIVGNLPKDLRRDIKRHLCLSLLTRVPMFAKMDEQLLDAMCDRLKPVLYTEDSFVVREGDPVTEMLFIMRGKLLTVTTNGGRTGFFNSVFLNAGDFCGEELLTWALDPHSSSYLPISTRTVQSKTDVEAFALMPEDLKFVAKQFRRLHSKQLQQTFRFYSPQWRTWAACFIQAAWRQRCRRKIEKSLKEAESRLQNTLAKEGGRSQSFGATIYASRFAANALRMLRHNSTGNARVVPLINLQKPTEPDFTSEDG